MRFARYHGRFLTGRRHRGPTTDHFDGRRFVNREPVIAWSREVVRWLASRQPEAWPRWIDAEPASAPPARVATGARITFVNHSTVLIQTAGLNLLTDPVYSKRVGPFPWLGARRVRAPGVRFDDLPKIDAVLLSHDHYDHLDAATMRRLIKRDAPKILCGLGVDRTLAIEGLSGGHVLDWWQSLQLADGLEVSFAPSRHFSGRGLRDQDATLWGSFVVRSPAGLIYFGGDTGYGGQFTEIRERYGDFACALLPIGCYEPRWFMESVHMSPDDAVRAHRDLGAARSVGIHFGTFRLGDEGIERPIEDLRRALDAESVDRDAFLVLGFGESIALPSSSLDERRLA